jgi:hypothetical protein
MTETPNDHCPLCHDMADDEDDVPMHIRFRCEVAERIRVEKMDLPPEGHDASFNDFGLDIKSWEPAGQSGRAD